MISFVRNIIFWFSDFLSHIAFSLPGSSKKEKEEDAEVEVVMGEMVTPPPQSFHVDRHSNEDKKE